MNTISYSKQIPVLEQYDVIVIGGGAAGIGAALAAAEKGAKTALVERFGFLGGMATAGFVNPMSEFSYNGRQVVGGIAWRFAQKLIAYGGGLVEEPRCNVSFNPEIYKLAAQDMLTEAGVKCYMNTVLLDCQMDGKTVKSVVIANKSGVAALEAKYFIDASGDADLCGSGRCGIPAPGGGYAARHSVLYLGWRENRNRADAHHPSAQPSLQPSGHLRS